MKLGKPNQRCVTACAHMLLLGALPGFAPPLAAARDVTFLVVSDVHYGIDQWGNNEAPNKAGIALMNNLPGTAWPGSGWGIVAMPRGVLVSGDCTDSGTSSNWAGYWLFGTKDGFRTDYPERGGSGAKLHYPVYEGYGNHDCLPAHGTDGTVLTGITTRNNNRATTISKSSNNLHYSWDWDDVHFVNLNLYPGVGG